MSDPPTPPSPQPLVIVGPTASGKSALALELARRLGSGGLTVEIVNADSMQVYRGMDVGTAKATAEERAEVRHHLLDVVEPSEEFSVAQFVRLAQGALDEIAARGALAIVVGGTGLYVQALVDGLQIPGRFPEVRERFERDPDTVGLHRLLGELDPVAATRIEPGNRRRIVRALEVTVGSGRAFSSYGPGLGEYPRTGFVPVGLEIERDVLTARIRARLEEQVAQGFLAEVQRINEGSMSRTARQALGYRELTEHLEGRVSLEEAVAAAVLRTRQFAVRQIKWFRRDPRIRWLTYGERSEEVAREVVLHWLGPDLPQRVGQWCAPDPGGQPEVAS